MTTQLCKPVRAFAHLSAHYPRRPLRPESATYSTPRKLVISDSHEGIKAAVAKVLKEIWQRCRVHFMRNALAYAPKTQRCMVSATIATVFAQETAKDAHAQWRVVADQLRGKFDKFGNLMDGAEHEVLAYIDFP